MKDFQQNKLYLWEARYLKNGAHVSYKDIQPLVDLIWETHELKYPPQVIPLPKLKGVLADANRLNVRFRLEGAAMKTIIHELAHSMTMLIDGNGHQHGPEFVGMYMVLLEKWMGVPMAYMWFTAEKDKLAFNKFVTPTITKGEITSCIN